jgi:fluoride exporter
VTYFYVVAGAVIGAPLRYFLGSQVQERLNGAFPWGTLVVNVSGCLIIGLILGLAEERGSISREARLFAVTGFLGSYTTFSAFGWETYDLARADDLVRAGANVVVSVVAGLAAVWLGAALARAV